MNQQQKALVITEVIREEARLSSLPEKKVHMPSLSCKKEMIARNNAVKKCFEQGIDKESICEAFNRDVRTIREILSR
jgi:hypothetical protein